MPEEYTNVRKVDMKHVEDDILMRWGNENRFVFIIQSRIIVTSSFSKRNKNNFEYRENIARTNYTMFNFYTLINGAIFLSK